MQLLFKALLEFVPPLAIGITVVPEIVPLMTGEVKVLFVSVSVVFLPARVSAVLGKFRVTLEAGAGALIVVVLVVPRMIWFVVAVRVSEVKMGVLELVPSTIAPPDDTIILPFASVVDEFVPPRAIESVPELVVVAEEAMILALTPPTELTTVDDCVPVTSPLSDPVKLPALVAVPLRVAVIVPALKLPLLSRERWSRQCWKKLQSFES